MSSITLDTTGERWIGSFPGLGRVYVAYDGSIDTEIDADAISRTGAADEYDRALRHGWGIPLSHLRLGHSLVAGTGVVDPTGHCLVIYGPITETTRLVIRLVRDGWRLLAPRLQPVTWDDDQLIALPTASPLIVRRHHDDTAELTGAPARTDSDCVVVDVPTHADPLPVSGLLEVRAWQTTPRPFTVLTGYDRFDRCAKLFIGGAIAAAHDAEGMPTPQEPEVTMTETLRLVRLPHASTPSIAAPDELDPLLTWWADTTPTAT